MREFTSQSKQHHVKLMSVPHVVRASGNAVAAPENRMTPPAGAMPQTLRKKGGFPLVLASALLASAAAFSGCASKQPAGPIITPVTLTAKLPIVKPFDETLSSQEKADVRITVVPVNYEAKLDSHKTEKQVATKVRRYLFPVNGKTADEVGVFERETTPTLETTPDELRFQVKIANKMSRVFRGKGTVVQYTVDNQQTAVDPSAYGTLDGLIVPPRSEQVVYISGPKLKNLPETTKVGVFFYDVVTNTDAAGNIVEKQNFEWYFNLTTETKTHNGQIVKETYEQINQ
jgi:hypothetical protein